MTALLWVGVVFGILLVIRFVHPVLVHRARDGVTRARINRAFLELAERGQTGLSRQQFGQMLGHAFSSEGASSEAVAMEFRCIKLRELFGVLTTEEFSERAHARVGMGLVELADMIAVLGHRFGPGGELRATVVDASEILRFVANGTSLGREEVNVDSVEQWLDRNALSVGQVGEILIAALFALTRRERGVGATVSETPIPPALDGGLSLMPPPSPPAPR